LLGIESFWCLIRFSDAGERRCDGNFFFILRFAGWQQSEMEGSELKPLVGAGFLAGLSFALPLEKGRCASSCKGKIFDETQGANY
jgi:hypothetical protein